MRRLRARAWLTTSTLMFGLCAVAYAVDSTSTGVCVSDGLSPWDTAEQVNRYVVDLAPLQTSWGTSFGIAPIIKSSKTATGFFGSLTSAQGTSRTHLTGVPLSGTYDLWNAPGRGLHPTNNTAPTGSVNLTGQNGNQFAAAISEFSTTDPGRSYNGILGAVVQMLPANPSRLHVTRVVGATNSCDNNSNLASLGGASVDAYGHLVFRADNFGATGGCALTSLAAGNNYFQVDLAGRNSAQRNVVSNGFPGAQFDAPATEWLLQNSAVTHNTPTLLPNASNPVVLGSNFNNQFVRGTASPLTGDASHLAAGVTDQRGAVSYTTTNCAELGSTAGIAAVLGKIGGASNPTDTISLFGLNASGNVTGTLGLTLPALVTDNVTLATNIAGPNQFDNYHGATFSRGGNGQVAIGKDAAGRLIVAAEVDQPDDLVNWPLNYIAVARIDCANGDVEWTMAGYIDASSTTGKPILDGPGGTPIGQMVGLNNVTGGTPQGPSVSSPMIDSVGNIWFQSAIERFGPTNTYNSGLIRAVYDPAIFGYELELVAHLGSSFHGPNSDTDWAISFLAIAANNEVSPGTAFSGNISEVEFDGATGSGYDPVDPRTLGGIVLAAEVVYDTDGNGCTRDGCGTVSVCVGGANACALCSLPGDCPGGTCQVSNDQDYQVLLYIGQAPSTVPPLPAPTAGNDTCVGGANNGQQCTKSADCPGGACATKSRMLSSNIPAAATAAGTNTTIKITVVDVPSSLPALETLMEGDEWYAGAPGMFPEGPPGGTFKAAQLQCSPFPNDWAAEGLVHFYGAAVIPNSTYEIRQCDEAGDNCSEPPLESVTVRMGDVVPAVGLVNFLDISAILDKFKGSLGAVSKTRAKLQPNILNLSSDISFLDISAAVDSFQGDPYPFAGASCP